jgi:hypothetical protein
MLYTLMANAPCGHALREANDHGGKVSLPLAGTLLVSGMTAEQAGSAIEAPYLLAQNKRTSIASVTICNRGENNIGRLICLKCRIQPGYLLLYSVTFIPSTASESHKSHECAEGDFL